MKATNERHDERIYELPEQGLVVLRPKYGEGLCGDLVFPFKRRPAYLSAFAVAPTPFGASCMSYYP
jgi:hypothetical protein